MSQEQFSKYDSEFCGSLPINLINVVQAYGILLVVDAASFNIVQASENTFSLFNVSASGMVGLKLDVFVGEEATQILQEKLHVQNENTYKIPIQWTIGRQKYLVLAHLKAPYYLLEIEKEPLAEGEEASFAHVFQDISVAMSAINNARTIEAICHITARELKRISGFDKVMVYRFDEDWNGHVLAEAMEKDMESYIGFTFPASDIPKQARDLYLTNPYRYIPDSGYTPVRLYPVINPGTNTFIDLSDCNIRGVSNVHLEYLRNMRVCASMSTRIIHQNKLWGLIACHHKTPRVMNYNVCAVFELLSGIISIKISSLRDQEKYANETALHQKYNGLIEELFKSNDLRKTLFHPSHHILELFSATGAVLHYNKKIHSSGKVPPPEDIDDLLLWLHTRNLRGIFHTNSLSNLYDRADLYKEQASGMLVLPLNTQDDEYLILFRAETIQTINWGGNPEERIFFEKDMKTYHPRFSFQLWQQRVTGVSVSWSEEELAVAENLRSLIFQYYAEKRR